MEAFESMGMLRWTRGKWKPIVIIELIALILSVIFSGPRFIPREYKSYTIVYPYNLSRYSDEIPSEQMLEFLASTDIKDEVIHKFDLIKHYDIRSDGGKVVHEKVLNAYDKNVVVKPTEFGAIELTVYDTSPDTAYQIVNAVLDVLNKKILQVQKEKAMEGANLWKNELDKKQHQIDSMSALSKALSTQYGMLQYDNQSRELSRAYYQSLLASHGGKAPDDIEQQMKNLEEKGIEFRSVNQHLDAAITDYNSLELKYEDAMKDVNKKLTFWNMVSSPFKPDTWCYPYRSLIVIGTCFAALIFSLLFMRVIERSKK